MAKFIFIGDQRDLKDKEGNSLRGHGPDTITAQGVTFRKGEVSGDVSEAVATKLRGNSHFREEAANARPTFAGAFVDAVIEHDEEKTKAEAAAKAEADFLVAYAAEEAAAAAAVEPTGEDPFPLTETQPQG